MVVVVVVYIVSSQERPSSWLARARGLVLANSRGKSVFVSQISIRVHGVPSVPVTSVLCRTFVPLVSR